VTADITLNTRVEKLEIAVTDLCEVVKGHEQELYGEHDMPGLCKRMAEVRELVPIIKMWIKVFSVLAVTFGATFIAFIWALITHSVELVH
jgi:hypothetical protein